MLEILHFSAGEVIPYLAGAVVLYTIYGVVYRLYLTPIAEFPGPKLAALTLWYEFYYDVFPLSGQYTFRIKELHEQYGPIVRINPWELHISTPQFYETLYSSNKKRNKWLWMTRMLGLDLSGFGTVDHNLHRVRRAAVNPYFSTANVRRLQPVIEGRIEACIERLRGLTKTGEVVRAVVVASAFSSDVIMMYCFGKSYNRLAAPDFDGGEYDAAHAAAGLGLIMKHNIWILRVVQSLPDFALKRLGRALAGLVTLKQEAENLVREAMAEKAAGRDDLEHKTIFHELLDSKLPPEEMRVERLGQDAQAMVVAGGETIAGAITVMVYHLLAKPSLLQKLKTELKNAIPNADVNTQLPLVTLEQLPYLTGVIKEGLRLSYGVSGRSQRISWEPLAFPTKDREWVIPPWIPVGMSSLIMHHDESIYPNSREFRPERWIEDPYLDRYLAAFSKGSRQCVGKNLAYAEMYLFMAHVFRRFGSKDVRFEDDEAVFELVDTDITDVEIASDHFIPDIRKGSRGVQIRLSA